MRDRLAAPAEGSPTPIDVRELAHPCDAENFVEDFLRLAEWLRDRTLGACGRS